MLLCTMHTACCHVIYAYGMWEQKHMSCMVCLLPFIRDTKATCKHVKGVFFNKSSTEE